MIYREVGGGLQCRHIIAAEQLYGVESILTISEVRVKVVAPHAKLKALYRREPKRELSAAGLATLFMATRSEMNEEKA